MQEGVDCIVFRWLRVAIWRPDDFLIGFFVLSCMFAPTNFSYLTGLYLYGIFTRPCLQGSGLSVFDDLTLGNFYGIVCPVLSDKRRNGKKRSLYGDSVALSNGQCVVWWCLFPMARSTRCCVVVCTITFHNEVNPKPGTIFRFLYRNSALMYSWKVTLCTCALFRVFYFLLWYSRLL